MPVDLKNIVEGSKPQEKTEEVTQEPTEATQEPTEATQEPTEATQEDISNVGDVNEETKTISVDMYGVQIDLPIEKAKTLISKRDSRSSAFNELSNKVKDYETRLKEAERKAQALEAAKNGQEAEAEALFNQKLNEKVSKYHQKIVDGELKGALASHPEFIGGAQVTEDAIALIKTHNKFELDESDSITANGKTVTQIVSEFIADREAFRRVNKGTHSRAQPTALKPPKEKPNLSKGLEKLINK